jgi:hypothetical protein
MPSTSAKQHRFMAAIAHNPSFAKKAGVPQSVGKDFAAADKGKTFKKGGMMTNMKSMFGGKETYGEETKEAKAIKAGKITPKQYAMGEKSEEKKYARGGGIEKKGKTQGTMVKMAMGGSVSSASRRADGIAQRGKTKC